MNRPFSFKWMFLSMLVFIAIELALGGLLGKLIVGKYASLSLKFTLQGLLNLASYFIGGIVIGLISPGIRIHEPAAGAFCAVALMLSLSLFTTYAMIQFSALKMILGGGIAFCLAIAGAVVGERMAGNKLPED